MGQKQSEHSPDVQGSKNASAGKFMHPAGHLIPAIAVALAAGCGSNGDFIPYGELPAAAVQDAILVRSQTAASASVKSPNESTNQPIVTTPNETSADSGTVGPAKTIEPTENSTAQPEASSSTPAVKSSADGPPAVTTVAATSSENGGVVTVAGSKNESEKTVVSSQTGLQGPADVPEIENAATEVREVKLLVPEKRFLRDRGTTALRVNYDDIDLLKVLNMEPVPANAAEHFPGWLQELNGKSVRIRGFMYPTFEATGLTEFTMARDNGICCFVRKPKIYDVIGVTLAQGMTTDYIEGRPFDVEGTFHIEPEGDEHGLYRLYRISDARVVR